MEKWVELKYVSPWTHEETLCILTDAEAGGNYKGFKFAIHSKEYGRNVAFWPIGGKEIARREIEKEEAAMWADTVMNHCPAVMEDFRKKYF